jgi:hypothetical protein
MAAFLLPLAAHAALRFGVRKGAELLAKRKAKKIIKARIREEAKKRIARKDLVKVKRESRRLDKQIRKSGGRVRKHLIEQSKVMKEFIKEAPKIKQSIIDSAKKAEEEIRKIKLDK